MSHIFFGERDQEGGIGIFLAGKQDDLPMLLGVYHDDTPGSEGGFIKTSTMRNVVVDWAVVHGWCGVDDSRIHFHKFSSALDMMHDFRAYMVEFGQLHYLAISIG